MKEVSCPSCSGVVEVNEDQVLVNCPFCRNQFSVIKESGDFFVDNGFLIKYNGGKSEVEVPFGVKSISPVAFQDNTITKIVLPEGIEHWAFAGNNSLETIILPDSMENIPFSAFMACVSLKSILLPKNIKNIGERAFEDCIKLSSIEIPPMVEIVNSNVFMGCESLETITCYENTKFTGDDFFCESLSSINVLDSETGELISTKRVVDSEDDDTKVIEDDGMMI